MISFLFPALLVALSAIAVPIIIHFFYRRQLKVVPISTLRFLKIADETLPRQPRLQHLLLLLLRCLLVALLVFILAKPYFAKKAANADVNKPLHRIVLLDRSLGMTLRDAEKSSFDTGKKIAADLARGLRYQDTITPLAFAQSAVPLTLPREAQHDRAERAFQGSKAELAATSPRHALQAALRYCNEPTERDERNEVIILTDIHSANVPDWVDSIHYAREAKNLSRIVLVPCGVAAKPNFGITSARLVQPTATSTANHALWVQVSGSAGQPFEKKVEATLNDAVLGVFTARSDKGDPATVEIPLPSAAGGLWRGSVRLMEEDSLAEDNQRFFCFKPSRSDRVLLVDGSPSAVRSLSETYYINVALGTLPDERALDVTVATLDKAPWDAFDKLGTILFANVPKFTAEQAAQILAFVRGGGNVIFALGDQVDSNSYNKVLRTGHKDEVLPASLGQVHGDAGKRMETFFFGDIDPAFDGFNLGENVPADAFRQIRFYSFYQLQNVDPNAHVIARFNSGEPAVLAKENGDGHVFLFVSSLSAVWNDFPLRPTYLPFWRNFLAYLVHLGSPPRQFLVGDTARVQLSSRVTGADKLLLLAPNKKNLTPIVSSDSVLLPNVPMPGLYRVVDAAGAERDPGFAANIPARETLIATATPEDLAKLKGAGYEVIPASDATAITKLARPSEENAFPLAAWVALLGVIAAAGEWMFSNHLSREGGE